MEAFGLRKIQRQIMGQDAIPQLGLRARDDVVRFGQFLKIIRTAQHWVMVKLLVPDLHHMQDDLRILWVVLIPAFVQRLARAGQGN